MGEGALVPSDQKAAGLEIAVGADIQQLEAAVGIVLGCAGEVGALRSMSMIAASWKKKARWPKNLRLPTQIEFMRHFRRAFVNSGCPWSTLVELASPLLTKGTRLESQSLIRRGAQRDRRIDFEVICFHGHSAQSRERSASPDARRGFAVCIGINHPFRLGQIVEQERSDDRHG